MRLLDYPGLFRNWPPTAHDAAGVPIYREHCLDTGVLAFTQLKFQPRQIRIRILTELQGILSMREIADSGEIFAQFFCNFLNKHRGKTIGELGELDASFLA
jgi:hypothetical protein